MIAICARGMCSTLAIVVAGLKALETTGLLEKDGKGQKEKGMYYVTR